MFTKGGGSALTGAACCLDVCEAAQHVGRHCTPHTLMHDATHTHATHMHLWPNSLYAERVPLWSVGVPLWLLVCVCKLTLILRHERSRRTAGLAGRGIACVLVELGGRRGRGIGRRRRYCGSWFGEGKERKVDVGRMEIARRWRGMNVVSRVGVVGSVRCVSRAK